MLRELLSKYRTVQYKILGRHKYGSMPEGELCTHDPFEEEINYGDVVHPCVRYIEESFLGHKWWMVYTPYYAANDTTENPILCYSDSNEPVPPTHWKFFCQVQGQPEKGYNSDPTLLYSEGKLVVMWRENLTPRCDNSNFIRATFGAEVISDGIGEVYGPLVGTNDFEKDTEVSPTFIKGEDGRYKCLAMSLRFHYSWFTKLSPLVKKILGHIFTISDLLGIWSQQKSYGIAQWSSDTLSGTYKLDRTIVFSNCNKLYRPWHMDFFEWNHKLYAIVQSNQSNADICLAESEDGIHFNMFHKPLMTNASSGKIGIYKPTGGVVDNQFYLYYTAQNINDRKLNQLFLTRMPFPKLYELIKK